MPPLDASEETLKNTVIVPYLQRLGCALSDLTFEADFSIRVGRTSTSVGRIHGRADILVRRGDKNLFVVEVKREGLRLTEDDKAQAISYALLTRPLTPVAITTNGREFRVYNAVSEELLSDPESTALATAANPVMPADLASILEEAASLFLSISPDNLLRVCRSQVELAMGPLRGSATDRNKKYIPDLIEPRAAINAALKKFADSPYAAFPVIAEPGSGKTCLLCSYAERLLVEGRPVLFYRSSALSERLLDRIAEDFNWRYGEEDTARNVLRRLSKITTGNHLTIVIDAIDESPRDDIALDLVASCQRLEALGIKVVFSCKSTTWESIAQSRGVSIGLAELCFNGHKGPLPVMSSEEFHRSIDRYTAFFGVVGAFELAALEAARRSPFFLRVLFSVASALGQQYLTLSSIEFFREYLEQAISRLAHRDQARSVLTIMAQLLFADERETVEVDLLVERSGGVAAWPVLRELLDFQILQETNSQGVRRIGFYFSLLRDYVVVTQVKRWNTRPIEEVIADFHELGSSIVQADAISFAYRYGGSDLQRALDGSARQYSERFLMAYKAALERDFGRLREQLPPHTSNEFGFIAELDLRQQEVGWFGFRALPPGGETVQFLPASSRRRLEHTPQLLALYGGEALGARSDFGSRDPGDLAINEILREHLQRAFNQGGLDESVSVELANELAYVMVCQEPRSFGLGTAPRPWAALPVAAVRSGLHRHLLRSHFERVRGEELRRRGRVSEKREGGFSSWSWYPSIEDRTWIESQANEHGHLTYDQIVEILDRAHRAVPTFATQLQRALVTLEASGRHQILPAPLNIAASDLWSYPEQRPERTAEFMRDLLPRIVDTARLLVRHNFPTCAGEFFSIAHEPLLAIVLLAFEDPPAVLVDHATVFLCQPTPGQTVDQFLVYREQDIERGVRRDPEFRFVIRTIDGEFTRLESDESWITQRGFWLASLFHPSQAYLPPEPGRSYSNPRFQPVLRAAVYNWIRPELPRAFAKLATAHGATFRSRDWELWKQTRH